MSISVNLHGTKAHPITPEANTANGFIWVDLQTDLDSVAVHLRNANEANEIAAAFTQAAFMFTQSRPVTITTEDKIPVAGS